jgi:hypothetical protein
MASITTYYIFRDQQSLFFLCTLTREDDFFYILILIRQRCDIFGYIQSRTVVISPFTFIITIIIIIMIEEEISTEFRIKDIYTKIKKSQVK